MIHEHRESKVSHRDETILSLYKHATQPGAAASLETTHGLIQVTCGDSPFMFISGIANRALLFDVDVGPLSYAQNTCGAHNAGIVLAWLLPKIEEWFGHSE